MLFLSVQTALSLLSLATLAVARDVHSIDAAPAGWKKGARASPDSPILLRLTLAAADENALHDHLLAVSDPASSQYGKHLSRNEVAGLVAPTMAGAANVAKWIADADLTHSTVKKQAGHVLVIDTTIAEAEKLLAPAEFYVFSSVQDADIKVQRTLQWGVPDELAHVVETANPSTIFPVGKTTTVRINPRPVDRTSPDASSCNSQFTPQCARDLYDIGDHANTARAGNVAMIYSDGGHATKADLNKFLTKFVPAQTAKSLTIVSIDNGASTESGGDYDIEAALDVDALVGIAAPAEINLGIAPSDTSSSSGWPSLVDFADTLLDMDTPPAIVSISYGGAEADFTGTSGQKTLNEICNAFAQLGTMGTSVLASSGDSGVACSGSTFEPQFPASCPYVTAVGGTDGVSPQVADSISGGGFSTIWARPSWQDSAVSSYLTTLGSKHAGAFNKTGRAYPDVSAMSEAWTIYSGQWYNGIGGTSASCPTVAAVISHLNDVQLAAGKSTLGFLNPWIYSNTTSAWQDITSGSNEGCSGSSSGFPTATGWDPVTGFGTPSFTALQKLLP